MKSPVALLCTLAAASAGAAPSTEELKAGVAATVARYVQAVACPGVKIAPADVLVLVPEQRGETMPKFAVLWTGDLGCYGGSGSERTNLAIATFNTGRFVVQPQLSSPVVAFESPVRFVSRVVSSSADALVLEGHAHGPNDPNSAPSLPVRFTLRVDSAGDWKLVDKTAIAGQ